ncbi:hypothetical protein ACE02P_12410 [Shewanella bicestrii]
MEFFCFISNQSLSLPVLYNLDNPPLMPRYACLNTYALSDDVFALAYCLAPDKEIAIRGILTHKLSGKRDEEISMEQGIDE